MTCALFKEFLTYVNPRTAAKSRKILLFFNQCAAHSKDVNSLNMYVKVDFSGSHGGDYEVQSFLGYTAM
jgi:hypothetical protein